jgi:hypothetical protein
MFTRDTFLLDKRYRDYVYGLRPRPREWGSLGLGCFTIWMVPFVGAGVFTFGLAVYGWLTLGTTGIGAALFTTFFTLFWNGLLYVMLRGVLGSMLKSIKLSREGRLAAGSVTSYKARLDSDKDLIVTIGYRFITPDGQVIDAVEESTQNQLKEQPPLAPGTPVAVSYADPQTYKLL